MPDAHLKLVRLQCERPGEWTVGTGTGTIMGHDNKLHVNGGWWIVFTGSMKDAKVIHAAYGKVGYKTYKDGKVVLRSV